jgi:hypothetical protein
LEGRETWGGSVSIQYRFLLNRSRRTCGLAEPRRGETLVNGWH